MPRAFRCLVALSLPFLLTNSACHTDKTSADAPRDVPVQAQASVQDKPPEVPREPFDKQFKEQIHQTALGYFDYPTVDDKPHWAPGPCAPPQEAKDVPFVQLSQGGPESLHNEKLYYLHVKNHESYLHPPEGSAPVGQVVVKQAYQAYEIKKKNEDPWRFGRDIIERDGRRYSTGEPLALFIMVKLDEKTPYTDHGWIYGVTKFDGEVEESGLIQSCANCHAHAAHDRLFGSHLAKASKEPVGQTH